MHAPWSTMRSLGDKNVDGNRSTRSAAVGPVKAVANASSGDMENQGANGARRPNGVVTGTTILDAEESAGDHDADPGPDGVDTHMSVFTFLKIVSAQGGRDVMYCFGKCFTPPKNTGGWL